MNKFNILFIVLLLWVTMSCSEDEKTTVNETMNVVSETTFDNVTVKIFSKNNEFKTGYNNIYVKFYKNNNEIEVNISKLMPMMNMGMHIHSTPNEVYYKEDNYVVLPVSFVMPTGDGTYWYLDLAFEFDGIEYTGEAKFKVENSENVKSFKHNDVSYFVTLVKPMSPIVGMNDFKILINKKESMISWPIVENFSVEVKPWMPDMDHGSPNNVNPIYSNNGFYEGKINFTMTGLWTVTSTFKIDTISIGEVVHTINF